MKYLYILTLLICQVTFSQAIRSNGEVAASINGTSAFIDASAFSEGISNSKGLLFPRTDLTNFQFTEDGDFFNFSTFYDGMVVYNSATGLTVTAGDGILSGIGSQAVTPGLYYFSNPDNLSVVGNGRWIPIGSSANNVVKTREVIKTIPANSTTATVDLTAGDAGSQGMAGVAVTQFIGAKIYNNTTGQLQMDASSSYVDGTAKILTTGNGFISQVLPAGTYKFVIEYK
ncbi:hypothetical protein [Flavobacterium tegetincola]|uniref:hypothetical protein n=1 Tax=Flavobacterium tegetincola TaxID=150172 RepID=UPI0004007779|nr:hypothetical protein [Flavobacterium tegetincola]